MTKDIMKPGSTTFAKVELHDGKYTACIMQGKGFEQVFHGSRTFKTQKGAERWVNQQFANL